MNDKSLLSLREISGELNLKYKTILNFKNQLGRFLPGVFDGKNFKYFPASKEILSLIAALRDEGYTFAMIQEIFLRKRHVINDPQIKEWVGECIESHGHYWMDSDGSGHAGMDGVGLRHASMDVDGSVCASMDQYGSVCAKMDADGSVCANPDADGSVCANPDADGSVCASMDADGSVCAKMDADGSVCAKMDEDGSVCASMDADGSVCAKMDADGSIQANPDADEPVQAGTDQSKPGQPDPDQDGLAHSGTDLAAQIRTSLDEAKQVWLKEVEVLIRSLLAEQSESIQKVLQKMATQSNIAITALCEASEDTRKSILALDTRLTSMEKGLDMEEADPLELYQVAPENYQVDLPEISLPVFQDQGQSPEGDLAPVRDSITNGIPDREKVVAWIISRREEDLQANSYSALAAALNEAKIPTLSGRDTWAKGTIRNLIVRNKAG